MYQRNAFEASLRDLQQKLLKMGCAIQDALQSAVLALKEMNVDKAQTVVDGDVMVNRQEHDIEDLCIRLIATQQPVARDLRMIVAGMRIAADLERMGDLAVDVAKAAIRLKGQTLIKPLIEIPKMLDVLDSMISRALRAYVDCDVNLAKELARDDDEVDRLYRYIVEELFEMSAKDHTVISQAMTLSFVGRYLERIGDHATNIGEGVIYIATGERSDLN